MKQTTGFRLETEWLERVQALAEVECVAPSSIFRKCVHGLLPILESNAARAKASMVPFSPPPQNPPANEVAK